VLKLLRAGATVVVTSRFPVDTARRIAAAGAAEGAAEDWASRCEVHGLDLRDVQGLSDFIVWMQRRFDRLDILVNNATQVRKRHFCAILY
jgi:NAD(P)-dependent dehydrogenase (short-subunit alcohol dehydrogenase family)